MLHVTGVISRPGLSHIFSTNEELMIQNLLYGGPLHGVLLHALQEQVIELNAAARNLLDRLLSDGGKK